MQEEAYLKYVGQASLVGVPARDLTRAEAQRFGEKRLLDSGLYVLAGSETPAKQERRPAHNKQARVDYENKEE